MSKKLFKRSFYRNGIEIEDSFSPVSTQNFLRFIITADNECALEKAAVHTTSTPSGVVGRPEGGIERYLSEMQTPDSRAGALVQLWMDPSVGKENMEREWSLKIRQGSVIRYRTAIFDSNPYANDCYETKRTIAYCGDKFYEDVNCFGREMWRVPLMAGSFLIDKKMGIGKGPSTTLWFWCKREDCWNELENCLLGVVGESPGVIAPFDLCPAGSKDGSIMAEECDDPEERKYFKAIGPTTNHKYVPSLRTKLSDSRVPTGIEMIPELVINGVDENALRTAMYNAIEQVSSMEDVIGISGGKYNFGRGKIYLRDLF